MLYFGTSGFSYQDWVGVFYPKSITRNDWLRFYSREFNAVEINSTYYANLQPSVIKTMLNRTRPEFLFVIKGHQSLTHTREPDSPDASTFIYNLSLFSEASKLGCVLIQFPYSFSCNIANRRYVESLKDKLGEIPMVVEFRNARWIRHETFDWLRHMKIGFCCVDEPRLPNLVPPVAEATSDIAYVRFHGRNAAKWWAHEQSYERYDYTYSREELMEWVPNIRKLAQNASKVFIFANNHWRGQAVDTIRQLKLLLE